MADTIIERCEAQGLRLTEQRRIIAGVLEDADDHPDVEELYARASSVDPRISLATVYRTVKLFEEAGILEKLDLGDGRVSVAVGETTEALAWRGWKAVINKPADGETYGREG